jgi:hypothetical protein
MQTSPMPRPQFALKTLFWLMLVVAAFFGGFELHRQAASRELDDLRTRQAELEKQLAAYSEGGELTQWDAAPP